MLPPFASTTELDVWLGSPGDPDRSALLLQAASALIRNFVGVTWVDADGNLDAPEEARIVALQVAARASSNVTGATSWSETTGPFTTSMAFSGVETGIFLTDAEKAILRRVAPDAAGYPGLSVLSTTRGPLETPAWEWCDSL